MQNLTTLSGRLGVSATAPRGPIVVEQEPNSTDFQVQYIGIADTATKAQIYGHISDDGTDNFDGFRFRAASTMRVKVTLTTIEPTPGTNLEMFWFDATSIRLAQLIKGTGNPESGSFTVLPAVQEFDLIVYTVKGSSGYSLTVETAPVPAGVELEAPPGDAPQEALLRYRGANWPMVEGEVVALLEPETHGFGPGSAPPFAAPAGMEIVSRHDDVLVLRDAAAAALVQTRDARALATCEAAARLRKDPHVRAASPNYLCSASTSPRSLVLPRAGLPSDEHLALQWHLPQIRATEAWEVTRGSPDVVVAVLDSGIASRHPDLQSRLVAGYDFVSDPTRSGDGNGIDPDPEEPRRTGSALPTAFHGTQVAGILGAVTDNRIGVAAVDWESRIMPVRVLTADGTGTVADIVEGLRYAAKLGNASATLPAKRADVVCMSFGTPANSPVLEAAINEARGSGCVLVAAAGNDASTNDTYPAAYPACISVGATRLDRALARYSNAASSVDIVAPGGDMEVDQNGDGFPDGVLSTSSSDAEGYTYRFLEGTSMAAPQVAAAAALVKAANSTLTANEIEYILLTTAKGLGTAPRGAFPFRLLDTYQAVIAAQSSIPTEPKLVADAGSLDFGTSTSSAIVHLTNAATRLITITGTRIYYSAGFDWLDVQLNAPTANLTASELKLSVNRALLPVGTYAATVEIQAKDQFPVRIHLIVRVGDPGPLQDTIHVLLVEAASRKVVAQVDTDVTKGFAFEFKQLSAGDYFVVAGTDRNGNNLVGDQGEFYGSWPTPDAPQLLTLVKDQTISNVNFGVFALTFGLSTSSSGFTRLR